jgi:hypothetical protein
MDMWSSQGCSHYYSAHLKVGASGGYVRLARKLGLEQREKVDRGMFLHVESVRMNPSLVFGKLEKKHRELGDY